MHLILLPEFPGIPKEVGGASSALGLIRLSVCAVDRVKGVCLKGRAWGAAVTDTMIIDNMGLACVVVGCSGEWERPQQT